VGEKAGEEMTVNINHRTYSTNEKTGELEVATRLKPYIVVSDSDLSKLEEAVMELVDKGYTPIGGISVSAYAEQLPYSEGGGIKDYIHFYQAMVLRIDNVVNP
jgi:hypothetical protein